MPFRIEIAKGDITQTDTEAIVNAANNNFWMGSGVAGAIKAAGGKSIEEQAIAKGPVMPGEAVFTGAGTLRFKYVIHAAVMGQDLRTSDKLIRQATVSSLNVAEQLGLHSIALPAFGTGVGGFPMKACAYLMLHTTDGYRPIASSLTRVQFCLFDEYGYALFEEALRKLER
jgi:O-acetyl-ADP-ribose deacetylase